MKYILTLILVMVLLSGCSFPSPSTMLENMLTAAEKPSFTYFYQKRETKTYYDGDLINIEVLQTWEDASTGSALHQLVDADDGTFYTVINNHLMTLYQEGKSFATVKQVPSLYYNELLTQKEHTIEELEALRKTHKLRLVEEQEIADEMTYHFEALPREESQFLGEQHLWINQVNWMIMKRRIELDKKIIEEKVLEFDTNAKGSMVHFTIPTEENENIEFRYEPKYEEKSAESIPAPIYYLKPNQTIELHQINEIVTPRKGFRLHYTRNGADYLQLRALSLEETRKNPVYDLQIGNKDISVQPIPNVGIELTFFDESYEYELLLLDPFATKAELQTLVKSLLLNEKK